MAILWMILIGFLAGLLARAIKPGDDSLGFIMTTLLGIVGAVLAGYAGKAMGVYQAGEPVGFAASVLGAVALLFLVQFLKSKKA